MRKLLDFLGIACGAAIFALGTQTLIVAVKLGSGGVGGIALLTYYLWGWHIGVVTMVLNIPLLLFAWREIGKDFVIRTTLGVLSASIFLEVFRGLHFLPTPDILLGALYGGVVIGIGDALVFRFDGSLGGGDIVAKILNKHYGFTIGNVGFVINIVVILISMAVLGPVIAMYTLVSLFVTSKVLDAILEGVPAKSAMIITEKGDILAKEMINRSGRGVTLVSATGGYTQGEKDVLITVVALSELIKLKRLVKQIDPEAFVIVSDAKEVLGKGFAQLG
ncbi:MAG: YitT family protein [Peptococcaceae bacterium]|nr:YitT family protein [Peptococcaceae bacterium]